MQMVIENKNFNLNTFGQRKVSINAYTYFNRDWDVKRLGVIFEEYRKITRNVTIVQKINYIYKY